MNSLTKRQRGMTKIIAGTGIFILFILLSRLNTANTSSLLGASIRLGQSSLLALLCYYCMRSVRIRPQGLPLSRPSKICLGFLGVILLFGLSHLPQSITVLLKGESRLFWSSLFVALSAGIFEESLVRGLFLSGLLDLTQRSKHSFLKVSVLSGILFGLLHLVNLQANPLQAVAQQVVYASIFGLLFAILRIISNSLWLPILVHSLFDFQPTITSGTVEANSWSLILLLCLPVLVISLVTLWFLDKDNQAA